MNKETVHSVKEKSMYRKAIQLNTVIKERTNEEGLMNQRKKGEKKREKKSEREREKWKHQGQHATEVQKKKKRYTIFIVSSLFGPEIKQTKSFIVDKKIHCC